MTDKKPLDDKGNKKPNLFILCRLFLKSKFSQHSDNKYWKYIKRHVCLSLL